MRDAAGATIWRKIQKAKKGPSATKKRSAKAIEKVAPVEDGSKRFVM